MQHSGDDDGDGGAASAVCLLCWEANPGHQDQPSFAPKPRCRLYEDGQRESTRKSANVLKRAFKSESTACGACEQGVGLPNWEKALHRTAGIAGTCVAPLQQPAPCASFKSSQNKRRFAALQGLGRDPLGASIGTHSRSTAQVTSACDPSGVVLESFWLQRSWQGIGIGCPDGALGHVPEEQWAACCWHAAEGGKVQCRGIS